MKKDVLKAEIARTISELNVVNFIKNNKEKDFNKYKEKLQELIKQRDDIYELKQETIDKVYVDFLKNQKVE